MNLLPAPVFNSPKSLPRAVAPPLPPSAGLSIFDDRLGDTVNADERDNMNEHDTVSTHPDDLLKGEPLRTPELINSGERSNSFYMVYSPRSKLVKIGITLYTYEECKEKYTKLYGNLESFHFLRIENDMTRERLERAFYQFFSETRMFSGKEFFHDVDSHGRDMLPIYLTLLTILTSEDLQSIRRFYLQHGTTGLAARLWVESQHAAFAQGTVEVTPAEAQALNHVNILSTETALGLSRANLNKPTTPAPSGFQGWDSCESESEADDQKEDDDETLASTLSHEDTSCTSHSEADTTEHLLAPLGDTTSFGVSLYAAYSARAELVKIGFTTLAYEECAAKYKKVYGHLDEFYFLAVENDLLAHKETRIEKVFYRLFEQTRIHPGREFFHPFDDLQRPMLPLYVTVLRMLAAEDTEPMRRFYRAHRHYEDMQDWIEQQLAVFTPTVLATVVNSSSKTGSASNSSSAKHRTQSEEMYTPNGGPPLPKHVQAYTNSSAPGTPSTAQSASPHSTQGTYGSAQSTYGACTYGVYNPQGTYATAPVNSSVSGSNVSVKTSSKAGVAQPAAPVPFALPQSHEPSRRGSGGEDMV